MGKSKEEVIRFANDEILVKGNFTVVQDVFAPDYVVHAGGKDHKGHSFVKRFARQLRSSLPDIRIVRLNVGPCSPTATLSAFDRENDAEYHWPVILGHFYASVHIA